MEYLFIYLLQLSGLLVALSCLMTVITVLSAIVCVLAKISFLQSQNNTDDFLFRETKKIIKPCVVISLCLCLFPSKQTLLLMGGTYIGKQAVDTVVTSDKMKKVNEIIDLQLDKYIKELKTTK